MRPWLTTLRIRTGHNVRLALIPHAGCVCEACLRAGSRGFSFYREFNPHKGGKASCKCEFMPGIEGKTRIEGYDENEVSRKWRRVKDAVVVYENIYEGSIASLIQEASSIDRDIVSLFRDAKRAGEYDSIFLEYLASFAGDGVITAQKWAKMEGKEVQLCRWLAQKGHDIEFLLPSSAEGDKTPDIRLDGVLWEIKRITSRKRSKVKSRISEGLEQSGNVIVDFSCNENADDLVSSVIEMLDDSRANQFIVVTNGSATLYKK